jgi:hypothetical protein
MKSLLIQIIFLCLFGSQAARAVNYFVRPTGDNSAVGTSYAQAWKSIERINNTQFKGGDTVFFEARQTFSGNIYLDQNDSGSADHPLVLTSVGNGKAIIYAGDGYGLFVYNAGGIEISNLEFSGSGTSSNKKEGIHFYTDLKNGQKLEHIRVDQVDIHGFGKSGLCLGSWDASYPGFKDVVISKVKSFDNETGMSSYDMADWKSDKYAHTNILIRDCWFLNSISSGIVLCGIDSGIVEYSRASNTGSTGKGVVGLWAWSCRNLIFQYCSVDGTVTSGPDGGGFDLDGGTESCIIQYCYTYNNAGPGYMHCDYPYSRPTRKNIIRYCLSENDGRKPADNRCSFLFISWGNGLEDCEMYNNTAYITSNGNYSVYGFWGFIMFGNGDTPHITNCSARNNIFYVKGDHLFLANLDGGSTPITPSNLILQGNCYFAEGNGSTRWVNNQSVYSTMNAWQDGSGQEMLLQNKTGFNIDPMLKNPGKPNIITNPPNLVNAPAYQLEANSPLIDSGLNLNTVFGVDIGKSDFFGNSPLQGGSQDVGFYETFKTTEVWNEPGRKFDFDLFPNPAETDHYLTVISEDEILSVSLISSVGELFRNCISDPKRNTYTLATPSSSGLYIILVVCKNGQRLSKKLLIV